MATTTTKDRIEERVTEALITFGVEREEINRDAEWEPLDVDSLDLVELAQIMEEEFGVQIREEDLKGITTVGEAIDFVAERADS